MEAKYDRRQFLERSGSVLAGALAGSVTAGLPARGPIERKPAQRFKLSCAAYSLRKYLDLKSPRMTLEEFIEKCAGWETDGVELTEYYFPKPITPEYLMRLKRQAANWGQAISGTPIGNNFALPPGPERDKQVADVKKWIDVSADLGSPAIRIFAGGAPKGVEEDAARKWVAEAIESCCDHAARRGVYLALENHGGVVATAEGLLSIIHAVGCEWVAVNLDTGNFHSEDPYAEMAQAAPYAMTCQVKTDVTAKGKKREDADLPRVIEILKKAGYRGFVTLEYEGEEEPMTAVPRHLGVLRKLVG